MVSTVPKASQKVIYDQAAQDYLLSLPPEHFREAVPQARQREITLESLALVEARRSEVHVFNELLVQYPVGRRRKPGQVVPDNMVVRTTKPIHANLSYNLPLEPAKPFWVLDYVFEENPRKDYDVNFRKYERELKVRYSLMFYLDSKDLKLFRHNRLKYALVEPNASNRYPIPELDLEIGLLDGWVRYWWQGKLLLLPGEMLHELEETRGKLAAMERARAEKEKRRTKEAEDQPDQLQRRLAQAERELAALRGRRGQS